MTPQQKFGTKQGTTDPENIFFIPSVNLRWINFVLVPKQPYRILSYRESPEAKQEPRKEDMNIARQLGSQVLLRSRIQHVCGTRQIIARSIFGLGDGSGDDGTSGNGVAVVTKRDIAAEIAETHELSYAKSQRIVNTVFDVITEVSL